MFGQDKAIEAMRFVRDQRQEAMARLCGDTVTVDDVPLPPLQVAEMPGPSEPAPPVVPLPPPIAPPILPPQAALMVQAMIRVAAIRFPRQLISNSTVNRA